MAEQRLKRFKIEITTTRNERIVKDVKAPGVARAAELARDEVMDEGKNVLISKALPQNGSRSAS